MLLRACTLQPPTQAAHLRGQVAAGGSAQLQSRPALSSSSAHRVCVMMFLACRYPYYGGEAVVDAQSLVPQRLTDWEAFMIKNDWKTRFG